MLVELQTETCPQNHAHGPAQDAERRVGWDDSALFSQVSCMSIIHQTTTHIRLSRTSPMALSSSNFINLLRMSKTSGERMNPLC